MKAWQRGLLGLPIDVPHAGVMDQFDRLIADEPPAVLAGKALDDIAFVVGTAALPPMAAAALERITRRLSLLANQIAQREIDEAR